jgi:hypothetical protein
VYLVFKIKCTKVLVSAWKVYSNYELEKEAQLYIQTKLSNIPYTKNQSNPVSWQDILDLHIYQLNYGIEYLGRGLERS